MGVELSDLQINVTQNLLKARFPQLNGLRSTLLQNNSSSLLAVDEVKNELQIVHCKARHHWIVATTVKCLLLISYTVPWMTRQRRPFLSCFNQVVQQ